MKLIDDMFAMRYRLKTYEKKEDVPFNKVVKEYRFTAELTNDDELKELEEYMTDLILNDDIRCNYATLDVSDPLDWERGDVWRKEEKVWYDKLWHDGRDLARLKKPISDNTQMMIDLYDKDDFTKRVWNRVCARYHDPKDCADALIRNDIDEFIQWMEPKHMMMLAKIGMWSCDWVQISRHIKDSQREAMKK